jgi:hypothetical protein
MLKYKMLLLFLALCVMSPLLNAQQPPMSATTGLGPGNSFTLFVTFQNPMPTVQGIGCAFNLEGAAKPGQEDFARQLRCSGTPVRDDDTHYRVKVGDFPQDIAAGDYKIQWISVAVDAEVAHQYQGSELPNLAPVAVSNPRHLEFSPIKKLEIKQ